MSKRDKMNTFDWVEIRIPDTGRAVAFYESLFDWQVVRKETADGSNYLIFDTGDEPRLENLRRGALWLRPGDTGLGIVVYIAVDDIDATLRRAVELGGAVVLPKTAQGLAYKPISGIPVALC